MKAGISFSEIEVGDVGIITLKEDNVGNHEERFTNLHVRVIEKTDWTIVVRLIDFENEVVGFTNLRYPKLDVAYFQRDNQLKFGRQYHEMQSLRKSNF